MTEVNQVQLSVREGWIWMGHFIIGNTFLSLQQNTN